MRALLPARSARAVMIGGLLWLVGLLIGMVAFAVPAFGSLTVPFLSANLAITVPVLVVWPTLIWLLCRRQLAAAPNPASEGMRMGAVFLAVSAVGDLIVVVYGLGAGLGFYSYLGIWVGYAMLVIAPWLFGWQAVKHRRSGG